MRRPEHIAIIMDGNRRWARARALPVAEGHRRGMEALRLVARAAVETGLSRLTLYGFSLDNRARPRDEVRHLMNLFRAYVSANLAELHRESVRLRLLGRRADIPADILRLAQDAESLTCENNRMTLSIAFNYGGRDEILRAIRRFMEDCEKGVALSESLDVERFESYLDTGGAPPPDLLIRTGGEKRLSDFLLWQSAYAEFVFLDALWPDFTPAMLEEAMLEYGRRDRRFGARYARRR